MKTNQIILTLVLAISLFSISATTATKTATTATAGVSSAQVINYLTNCSHHHYVYSVTPIPGKPNWTASIENCQTATVVVIFSSIIGHADQSGYCD